jgi:hypothetical protein
MSARKMTNKEAERLAREAEWAANPAAKAAYEKRSAAMKEAWARRRLRAAAMEEVDGLRAEVEAETGGKVHSITWSDYHKKYVITMADCYCGCETLSECACKFPLASDCDGIPLGLRGWMAVGGLTRTQAIAEAARMAALCAGQQPAAAGGGALAVAEADPEPDPE